MKIFLSWSGKRSKALAECLRKNLPFFLHQVEPWMSSVDIFKGDRWSKEIGQSLDKHQIGIICVTPENMTSPWLLFEAGALSKQLDNSRVLPLLLGMSPGDLSGPISQFQATIVQRDDFLKLIFSLNDMMHEKKVTNDVLTHTFDKFWPDFEEEIRNISETKISGTSINIKNVTSAFGKYGIPEPEIGNHVYFSSGFESHSLYSSVFELAQKRLYIWGRKNRKVFDKEHAEFFSKLSERKNLGFDFRALFLDPNAPSDVIDKAHQDSDFISQLNSAIIKARQVLENSTLNISDIAKKYKCIRHTGIVIVDDAVLFSHINYDEEGHALALTKAPFGIVGAETELGGELERSFIHCWNNSNAFE